MESVFYGRYELLEKIAAGGMAEVWKAKYQGFGGLEKTVVVKRILPQYSHDNEFVRMFQDEARIAVNLNHTNLVQTFDFGRIQDGKDGGGETYYLAMELVDGQDLQSILRECHYRRIPIPMELSVFLVSEVLRGLDYAHRRKDQATNKPLNIVHRDISPANILASYSGNVKVADFGIAKAKMKTSQTQHGTLKGKYSYMSPEQARGEDVDARSDIFSCGIILYELVTGIRPFRGKSELEILEKVKAARIEPPKKVNPHIPRRLADIIQKALSRDRNDRFQEAGVMSDRLLAVLSEFQSRADQEALSAFLRRVFEDKKKAERAGLKEIIEEAIRVGGRGGPKAAAGTGEGIPVNFAMAVIRYAASSDDDDHAKSFLAKVEKEINQRGGLVSKSGAGEIVAAFEEAHTKSQIARRTDYRRVAVDAVRKITDMGRRQEASLDVTAGVCASSVPGGMSQESVQAASSAVRRATMLAVRAGSSRVLIDEAVASGLGKSYALRQVSDEEGGTAFAPVRAAARPAIERRSSQGDRTFGRDDERDRLYQLLAEIDGGRGRAVAITGEPGMGKSHLVHDMIRKAVSLENSIFLGRCVTSGAHVPFSVFHELVRDMVGLPEGAGPSAVKRGLDQAAENYNLSPSTPEALAPLYAGPARMDMLNFDALSLGMRDLLGGLALQRPVVIIVEDLHWADPASKMLLGHLIDHRGANRIVYVVTTRPEFEADWFAERDIERISLGPLSREAMLGLTRDRLGLDEVSPELAEYIVRRSRGNPHYLHETLRSLTEKGVLSDESGGSATNRGDIAHNQAVGAVVARERVLSDAQREKVEQAKEVAAREVQGLASDLKRAGNFLKGLFGKAEKASEAAAEKARVIKENLEPVRTETDKSER